MEAPRKQYLFRYATMTVPTTSNLMRSFNYL